MFSFVKHYSRWDRIALGHTGCLSADTDLIPGCRVFHQQPRGVRNELVSPNQHIIYVLYQFGLRKELGFRLVFILKVERKFELLSITVSATKIKKEYNRSILILYTSLKFLCFSSTAQGKITHSYSHIPVPLHITSIIVHRFYQINRIF